MSRLTETIAAVLDGLRTAAGDLNELDGHAGDGDLGVTVEIAAGAVEEALPGLAPAADEEVLRSVGAAIAKAAPSTAGSLVATGLLRAAAASATATRPAEELSLCLRAAVAGIAERGKAEAGSKTMLDALLPATEACEAAVEEGEDATGAVAAAATAADAGARATARMTPRHGRAGWLADRAAGHEDAGARLVAIMLASAAASLPGDRAE